MMHRHLLTVKGSRPTGQPPQRCHEWPGSRATLRQNELHQNEQRAVLSDRPLSQHCCSDLATAAPLAEPIVNDKSRWRRVQRRRLRYFFLFLAFRLGAFFAAAFFAGAAFLAAFFLAAFFFAGFFLATFFLAAFFFAGFFLATFFLAVFLAAAFRVFLRAAGFVAAGFFRAAGFFLAAGFRLADFRFAARAATFAI